MRKALSSVAAAAGGKFVSTVLVSPTQADFSPIVQSASSAKAAMLFMGLAQDDQFVKAAESAGLKLTYLAVGPWTPADAAIIGPAAVNRTLYTSAFPPVTPNNSNPLVQQYLKDMAAEAKSGDSAAGSPNAVAGEAFQTWLSVHVIDMLVTQDNIAQPTSAAVMNALNTAKNINLDGVIPPWTPNAPGPAGFTRVSNTAYELVGYKNGVAYTIAPAATVAQAVAGQF
jgi:hypothetical protein